jgi:glucose-6-phosphate 1-dehydrogenase
MPSTESSAENVASAPEPSQAPPCTLVIFGAGGDLTKRLLMPALYNLSASRLLPDDFKIIGLDRTPQDTGQWRAALTDTMQSFTKDKTAEFYTPKIDEEVWGRVTGAMTYVSADFGQPETFRKLAEQLGEGRSAVFYLAVAARFFGPIIDQLGQGGLFKQEHDQFRRVVIEKPFGSDLPSAQALNTAILKQADESQIYRIDHFLGKETIQSIMAVRFANGLFEPTWRREFIDHVQITAAETIGVEERGAFYEPTGCLRDMVPNHLFQLLCMTGMEPPNSFDAEDVRTEKAKLVEAVHPVEITNVVRGQYTAGTEFDQPVPGYRQEPHVDPNSRTETYVAAKLRVENWRWAGVPFYLRTGKRLAARRTEIAIHFKSAPYHIFRDTPVDKLTPNVVRLMISPEEGITTQFSAKMPGPIMNLGKVTTSFLYKDFFAEKPSVGYETLLYDCMMGDATLFQRADNIEASWKVVQPALDAWSQGGEPEMYAAGSQGPAGADQLLARDGRHWLPL